MRIEALKRRAELNALIRRFFAERSVLEVETPILSNAGNTDANIESFSTDFIGPSAGGMSTRWLRTSPEYPMKRLLAAGFGDCYELGRVFRNGEAGRRHNPEFTMLEWYRVGRGYHRLMDETVELIQAAMGLVQKKQTVFKSTYRELFIDVLGIDPFAAKIEQLSSPLAEFRIKSDGLKRDDWLNLLLTHCIEPQFPPGQLLLLYDYPASQCALAQVRGGDAPVAERFEVYLGCHELANGYQELRDAQEQLRRFALDNEKRAETSRAGMPVDFNLIEALPKLPHCAGVALGVDRLLMAMLDTDDIRDVIAFPFAEA